MAIATQAVPDFLIGIVLMVLFAINLQWFPARGAYSILVEPGFNIDFLLNVLWHAALPCAAYVIANFGSWALAMRGSASSVINEQFIKVAQAKGLKPSRILVQYLGRNAILPLVPTLFITLGSMIGGAMFIETIFSYPGIGYFFARAIALRDYTLIQGILLIITIAIVLLNILAEYVYMLIDPRLRTQ